MHLSRQQTSDLKIYDESHLRCMALRQHELETVGVEYLVSLASESVAKTIFIGSVPIAILGYAHMWNGVINVFVIPSKHVPKYAKTFLSILVIELNRLWNDPDLNLHRMQTKSKADPQTDRWMHWLGFHLEGTMIGYSQHREDYRCWARVRNGTD